MKYLLKPLATTTILFYLFANTLVAQQKPVKKPNIIFILTDDLGYGDISVFFQNNRRKINDRSEPWTITPNLDKMAYNGAMLTNHYCGAPVCAPSRSSFLLGKSQGHANVRDNQFDKALEDNHTIASTLKKVGYTTAAFGKWGLQGLNNNGPDWPAHPLNRGFDYFFGYMRHVDGHEHYPKEGIYRGVKQVWDNRTVITDQLDKCYTTDLWTARAKKWIVDYKNQQEKNQPFFMFLSYETPHAVIELPTQQYPGGSGLKGGMQWTGAPGKIINTASGKVDSWIHPDYVNNTWDHDRNVQTAEQPWPDVNKRYATAVRRLDDGIGDIIQLLKDLKIDDNTLVIFTSDNGPSNESYLQENFKPDFFNSFGLFDGIKRDCLEGGVRVPAIAWWPGRIPANSKVSSANATYDWLPTFTDAAGVAAPASSDGVSLLPALTKKGMPAKSQVYIEYFQNQQTPAYAEFAPQHQNKKRNQMQLIRLGDLVGVRYDIKSQEDDFEIYNVVNDPQELHNLAANGGQKVLQQQMKDKTLQLRMPDAEAPRPYDNEYVAAVKKTITKPGLQWKFYNGNFPWVPNVKMLNATAMGLVSKPSIPIAFNNKKGVVTLTGYINVPEDGAYHFYLNSPGTAYLRIHEATVIDADFGYKPGTLQAGMMRLKAGLHPITLTYTISPVNKQQPVLKWAVNKSEAKDIDVALFRH